MHLERCFSWANARVNWILLTALKRDIMKDTLDVMQKRRTHIKDLDETAMICNVSTDVLTASDGLFLGVMYVRGAATSQEFSKGFDEFLRLDFSRIAKNFKFYKLNLRTSPGDHRAAGWWRRLQNHPKPMTLHQYILCICLLDDSVFKSNILKIFMTLSWHVFASAQFFQAGGNVISDPNPAERKTPVGDGRVARVLLDPAQYHQAMLGRANLTNLWAHARQPSNTYPFLGRIWREWQLANRKSTALSTWSCEENRPLQRFQIPTNILLWRFAQRNMWKRF